MKTTEIKVFGKLCPKKWKLTSEMAPKTPKMPETWKLSLCNWWSSLELMEYSSELTLRPVTFSD